ncbi:transporter substrate-binding domain-containing protein [Dyella solisilvae]|uniref:transporter substrate-binding domain-containing protein n=1 Tax=Dyella solisilvae TaxID=1920168 RepID=UPI001314CE91|nr:transporter substrate-binding domain-containing protein [Dyella solisilvae]
MLVLLLTMTLCASAMAANEPKVVRVAVIVLPPIVTQHGQSMGGFYVDLWDEIARRLKVKTEYRVVSGVDALSASLRTGQADVTMPQFVTWERDQEFDFSYPVLEAGQQVMVRDLGQTPNVNPLSDLVDLLWSRTSLVWLLAGVVLVLIPAHIVWFVERGREDGIIPSKRYFPGILQSLFWAATTLVTQADQAPRQWLARLVTFLLMFTGVVYVAFYTATLTSNMTVQQLNGDINGPEDLPGKRVATGHGTIPVGYLRELGARVHEFDNPDEVYRALMDRQVDAVFFATPVLRYYATHDWKGKVKIVGAEVDRQDAAFAFPVDSPLRRQVDSALLSMRKDGTYVRIYDKWFGSEQP